jgi:acyl-CoA synthetase (AMP-forming)/AMP-acid ligase II
MKVNRQELSPAQFLERAGSAYGDYAAVTDGETHYTWAELRARSRRMATALEDAGLRKGDRVALLAHNSEPVLLAHHAVPLAGGILVPINTRLSPGEVADIVRRSGASRLFYSPALADRLVQLDPKLWRRDTESDLEAFLESGCEKAPSWPVDDEDELVSINYTSGTTGPPKGVECTHRAAFLNALAMALDHRLHLGSRYLWTLPMFHCNGWMFPWALAAVGAESVCIARIDPAEVWSHLRSGVTHFCAAPTVLTMLANHPAAGPIDSRVRIFTAGSAPTPTLLGRMEALGFEIEHVYGLTETSGPATISIPPPDYQDRPIADRARLRARQGYANVVGGEIRVVDPQDVDVPSDGRTVGEILMRGNLIMRGYHEDPAATSEALEGGWFHTGDLAVRHRDESLEVVDRKKDIIVSGGENVSSIEVERAVSSHPDVLECAVVRSPDKKWGEVVKAFVTLREGATTTADDIIEHCRRAGLARFKVPRRVEFGPLPRTPTGKIRKHLLREREWRGRKRKV